MITANRDVRREGGPSRRFSRQIKQSGLNKLISGLKNGNGADDFAYLDKSSKERIKKLSAVNTHSSTNEELSYEMGFDSANTQEALPSISGSGANNRFKLPRKLFFDGCNGVDHVSVPRKLRSAMKKRNRESISPPFPDSKKLNYPTGGVDSPKRVGIKKSKLNLTRGGPNWSSKQSIGGPITKDEEEVVETLYALAGMFPDSEPHRKNKLDSVSLDPSPSSSQEASESHPIKLEGIKEDLNVNCLSRSEDVNPASDMQRSTEITVKVYSLNGPNIKESSDFPISEKLNEELDCSAAGVNLHKVLVKHEEQMPPSNSVNFCFPPGLHQDAGKMKQPVMVEGFLLERNPEIAWGQTTIGRNQLNQQHTIIESKNNGPALCPGLSSTVSSSACHGSLLQSCAAKIPAWLGTRPGSFQNRFSVGKASKVSTDRRPSKRCATHVDVSRLIQALQMPESKESLTTPSNQLRPHDILKQGVLMMINDLNGIRNYSNGVTSDAKNSNDTKSGILQHLRPHQDHSEAVLSSGAYTSHKQSFNFLSLSAGGGGKEPNNSSNGAGNGLEPSPQLLVPYHAQHPVLMPFSMSQTQYTSAYPNQSSSAAVQQAQFQSPSYLSSPCSVPYASPNALTKQQQQQRLWAAQLAAQYRNCGTSTAMSPSPSLQNGRQDSPALMTCIPTSRSSLEVLGPKYPQISRQKQQQLMAIAMPQARMKRQNHHVSSVYEETGVGFQAAGALPLQLLCNERL